MSEQLNPFEKAMNMETNGGPDPFAGAVPDPFGIAASPQQAAPAPTPPVQETATQPVVTQVAATPAPDLGSLPTAPNPFETPEVTEKAEQTETPAEIPASEGAANTPFTPIIDIGGRPGAADLFSEMKPTGAAVKEISGGRLDAPAALHSTTSETATEETVTGNGQPGPAEPAPAADEAANPLTAAMDEQDKRSIYAKPPIFEHGAVSELIEDLEQTFEDLRVAKADDFPELEDSIRVSWDVTYGKVRKTVPTPKKTKIGEYKKTIEASKEFTDALKKDKDKSPSCIVKPRITAQSKGERMALPKDALATTIGKSESLPSYMQTTQMGSPESPQNEVLATRIDKPESLPKSTHVTPLYKGVYTNMEDAAASGKAIAIVPGRDGNVYEIRNEESGTFITKSGECGDLSDIKAGFTPALPPVPRELLLDVISFFRSLIDDGKNYEAIVNIYRDREKGEYIAVIPKQRVTATKAESELTDAYPPERYLHYMDIHSHNVMAARFSMQDDRDEKATRIYAVIGRLDKPIPEMGVRISNGGKHLLIDPATVFEASADYNPVRLEDRVHDSMPATANRLAGLILQAFSYKGA